MVKLHLAALGEAAKHSASSSLDNPTAMSSSVSEGWSTFHLETMRSKHSNTDLSKSSLAKTETNNKNTHRLKLVGHSVSHSFNILG